MLSASSGTVAGRSTRSLGLMEARIVPIAEEYATSFHECLDVVAREKRYLAQIEAPPLERVRSFVRESVANDCAQFVALVGGRVVGWADIFPAWPPAIAHCGGLGMGVLPEYRRRGIGTRLLGSCISKAQTKGITRIELEVRGDNSAAIRLYEQFGFVREAVKERGMRFDGVYYDSVLMSLVKHEA